MTWHSGFPNGGECSLADIKMATKSFSSDLVNKIFPWHFALDRELRLVSLGKHLASRMKKDSLGMHANKLFHIARPVDASWSFEGLMARSNKPFLFTTRKSRMLSAEEYTTLLAQRREEQPNVLNKKQAHIQLNNLSQNKERESETETQDSGFHISRSFSYEHTTEQDNKYTGSTNSSRRNSGTSLLSTESSKNCPFSEPSFSATTSATCSVVGSLRASMDILALRARRLRKADDIKLHGEMYYDASDDVLIFAGNPLVQSLEEFESQGIDLADMPIHCHGREVLYGSMCQSVSARNSNDTEAKLATLDRSMAEVNRKKEQLDSLLHSILPAVCDSPT